MTNGILHELATVTRMCCIPLPYLWRAQSEHREDHLRMGCIMNGSTLLPVFLHPKPSQQPARCSISIRNDHATPTSKFLNDLRHNF